MMDKIKVRIPFSIMNEGRTASRILRWRITYDVVRTRDMATYEPTHALEDVPSIVVGPGREWTAGSWLDLGIADAVDCLSRQAGLIFHAVIEYQDVRGGKARISDIYLTYYMPDGSTDGYWIINGREGCNRYT